MRRYIYPVKRYWLGENVYEDESRDEQKRKDDNKEVKNRSENDIRPINKES